MKENPMFLVGKTQIELIVSDITEIQADAIVNAANSTLLGGAGVDGAIHSKGGPKILEECKKIRETVWPNGLPTGKAAITSAGNLRAKYVIHTVGPVWQSGLYQEKELLRESYQICFEIALTLNVKSVAFPAISTGAYGYPKQQATRIALQTVKTFLNKKDGLEKVIFALYSKKDFEVYLKTATELFG
jgi:O-acetyl-ADP-ribose deacetylase (regulator of RNase III)